MKLIQFFKGVGHGVVVLDLGKYIFHFGWGGGCCLRLELSCIRVNTVYVCDSRIHCHSMLFVNLFTG